ncbi:hypothetical protein [Desulfohalovibrio reitneri]|uniref:hypothetical protein n=1 Tax=Desulfohalovibrio reitneri TaxID=1307759 RepID=UPI0004A74932|nr:hypothetical protein [Desulfohalovibrio reitneri]
MPSANDWRNTAGLFAPEMDGNGGFPREESPGRLPVDGPMTTEEYLGWRFKYPHDGPWDWEKPELESDLTVKMDGPLRGDLFPERPQGSQNPLRWVGSLFDPDAEAPPRRPEREFADQRYPSTRHNGSETESPSVRPLSEEGSSTTSAVRPAAEAGDGPSWLRERAKDAADWLMGEETRKGVGRVLEQVGETAPRALGQLTEDFWEWNKSDPMYSKDADAGEIRGKLGDAVSTGTEKASRKVPQALGKAGSELADRSNEIASTTGQALNKAGSATVEAAEDAGKGLYDNREEIARSAARAVRRTGDEVTDKEFLDKTGQGLEMAWIVNREGLRLMLVPHSKCQSKQVRLCLPGASRGWPVPGPPRQLSHTRSHPPSPLHNPYFDSLQVGVSRPEYVFPRRLYGTVLNSWPSRGMHGVAYILSSIRRRRTWFIVSTL